ncbi:glycerophosphodiester phosphodiesterase [Caldimonas thermodepolymerans]|jgi:glycerophosphoryl diester phosphodiesterase|uniref:glycerophosphodiester phosphodiesterase n=1 Tax=Caldimonas thermodepolymerans TaxID=215580 RepID=A0A2S5T7T0_9BURK|nr:glycerophosphodiester phosphodiesterase family protein [Caldimonas thermodepolymerans]PPE71043.1 glycerophosphodiester phosphodiesterase [Caldimonas thermodepolymerans]QPC31345.1 glycerophosphodiester phosphodiesterase [Caldimonas thermodepolymerans]RDH99689.1 glycerophosphoryl diester phosphodiesterase [Caldimonas thermodepolymerans]TCP07585.1 glycerophosphoryl diester phosphodiesterase [Caldimonas thermodepolymerans]UZG44090.1 glycerophosphodiester phosphodiesterase family protein [Caldim
MRPALLPLVAGLAACLVSLSAHAGGPHGVHPPHGHPPAHGPGAGGAVQLGPRPFFLVEDMADGPLKRELQACARRGHFRSAEFSIGHRGAALQFPEHTLESYRAAARMGAGILECDVTFTKDKELVCRHAQNDLHTTTNILATPLAAKCTRPFTPATFDADGNLVTPASAECRTTDITLAEFKTLRGKMDDFNPRARTVEEYLQSSTPWRTDLYAGPTSGTLLTHRESIELFRRLGVKMTPELKTPVVPMPFDGFTQEDFAQKLIDEYKQAGVPPRDVYPQSFDIRDVLYWVRHEPAYGRQAVYLDDANTVGELPGFGELQAYRAQGIRIVAPPLFALLSHDGNGNIVPSAYARNARAAGLDIITWTLERSGILADGNNGFYYQTIDPAIGREGDVMRVLDVLGRQIGVLGVFSDWPATTTFYANCAGLR